MRLEAQYWFAAVLVRAAAAGKAGEEAASAHWKETMSITEQSQTKPSRHVAWYMILPLITSVTQPYCWRPADNRNFALYA